MKPKETSCTISVCCHVTSDTCCAAKDSIRTIEKSQSFTEPRVCTVESLKAIDIQKDIKMSSVQIIACFRDGKTSPATSITKHRDINCQCEEKIIEKLDAQTQCDVFPVTKTQLVLGTDERNVVHADKHSHETRSPVAVEPRKSIEKTTKESGSNASVICRCPDSGFNVTEAQPQFQTDVMCECPSPNNKTLNVIKIITQHVKHSHEIVKPGIASRKNNEKTREDQKQSSMSCLCPQRRVNMTDAQDLDQVFVKCESLNAEYTSKKLSEVKTPAQQDPSSSCLERIAQELTSTTVLRRDAKSSADQFRSSTRSSILVNDAAQTSDLPINLDFDTMKEHPLFVKIVAFDKLH